MPYYSNRKNSYKLIRSNKRRQYVMLESCHGARFRVSMKALEENGYKLVKHRPKSYKKL